MSNGKLHVKDKTNKRLTYHKSEDYSENAHNSKFAPFIKFHRCSQVQAADKIAKTYSNLIEIGCLNTTSSTSFGIFKLCLISVR